MAKRVGLGLTESLFSRLPAELRNKIWESALITEQCHEVIFTFERNAEITFSLTDKNATSLLMTCKQVRQECTNIFYHHNTFKLRNQRPYNEDSPYSNGQSDWVQLPSIVVKKFLLINTMSHRLGVTGIVYHVSTSDRPRQRLDVGALVLLDHTSVGL
ncbi:uncharacterized protein RHO25_006265 [Cercospora beticola]|uniref:2EXR domain-containing protein n=1 Tax=Cercospora beticola TaxID=122368 RepID=A0ABZ0NQ86_CERBT|nr:hypothetical protein RHO25_006265 [Cercospora beticola]